MYLISAYFDEKTNRRLQGYIDRIAEVSGNTFMTANKVPPHMTISAIEARGPEVLLPAFEGLAGVPALGDSVLGAGKGTPEVDTHAAKFLASNGSLYSGEIQIVSVGQLFPYVMYSAVVVNEYLLGLSQSIYSAFSDIPETSISKYYRPLSWLPHITLGKTLDKDQMQAAFGVMQEGFAPFKATITEIGLARVNPHEDLVRVRLFP